MTPTAPLSTNIPAPPKKPVMPADADEFYKDFDVNCDRAGTPLLEHFREYFKNLLVFGRAATLVDLPKKGDYATLLEQKQDGALDPYLIQIDPRQIINYQRDKNGKLEWIVYSSRQEIQATPFDKPATFDNWYYFDQKRYAHYRRELAEGERTTPDDAVAELVDEGEHALADEGCVPIIYRELPKGLWLMNRAYSAAKDHLNTDNVLGFALYMAALCMPIVKFDGEFNLALSEAGFIKLPKDAEFEWTEPEGKSFAHLADRIMTLKEEIFRSFYLIAQSRSQKATPMAQSGISKQEDMNAPKKILNLFGDVIRAYVQEVYDYVEKARGGEIEWDVRGLEFPEGPPDEEVDSVAGAQAILVPSITFEKELYKKVVLSMIPDANKSVKDQIFAEIDAAPSAADREAQQMQQRVQSTLSKDTFPSGSI
jgi:hypothetical protein